MNLNNFWLVRLNLTVEFWLVRLNLTWQSEMLTLKLSITQYSQGIFRICSPCIMQNVVIKTASNICSILAFYTLSDLVSNHPKFFIINFEQVYYQIFLVGNLYSTFLLKSEIPALDSLFNKVANLKACNFIKKRHQHRCFPIIPISLKVAVFENFRKSKARTYFLQSFRLQDYNLSFLISKFFESNVWEILEYGREILA